MISPQPNQFLRRPTHERTLKLRADPQRYRHMQLSSFKRCSAFGERFDVSLPAVQFLARAAIGRG